MKTKTDLYTKIVLTVIAVALVGHLIKDIDLVSTAQASELDLSAMKIENVSDNEGTTFFIYENNSIKSPFGDSYKAHECEISYHDIPTYIVTSKKFPGTYKNIKINKTR